MITKSERAELRSLIRQRFKVLRCDVEARKAELVVELDDRIKARFAADDKAWADAMYLIEEAAREANRKANDVLRELGHKDLCPPLDQDYRIVNARELARPTAERFKLRRDGMDRVDAQVAAAKLNLERQEVELLTRLVSDALESDEARAFLGLIPTVSQLVPTDRLLAIVGPVDGQ